MRVGICRFCGETKSLIRAHIIPQSLYPRVAEHESALQDQHVVAVLDCGAAAALNEAGIRDRGVAVGRTHADPVVADDLAAREVRDRCRERTAHRVRHDGVHIAAARRGARGLDRAVVDERVIGARRGDDARRGIGDRVAVVHADQHRTAVRYTGAVAGQRERAVVRDGARSIDRERCGCARKHIAARRALRDVDGNARTAARGALFFMSLSLAGQAFCLQTGV